MIDIKIVHGQMIQDVWVSVSLGVPMISSGSNFGPDILRRYAEGTGPCQVIDFACQSACFPMVGSGCNIFRLPVEDCDNSGLFQTPHS